MYSLQSDLVSTMRLRRNIYAYAYCCLLPLSTALRPTAQFTFNSPTVTTIRSRASGCGVTSDRLDCLPRPARSRCLVRMSPNRGQSPLLRWNSPLAQDLKVTAIHMSLWGTGLRRGVSGTANKARSRRGMALRMGKGLDRKKAKKSQVSIVSDFVCAKHFAETGTKARFGTLDDVYFVELYHYKQPSINSPSREA